MSRPNPRHQGGGDTRRLGRIVLRLRRTGPTPEERLSEVVEEHRRELEEQTRRFEETLRDLERREQLLSDSRASVERMLRLGTRDLDAREADFARLVRDLSEREERLREREERMREREEELAHRRSELGAVELKRLAVEQRERALDAREERVAAQERRLEAAPGRGPAAQSPVRLALVPGTRYRLVELEPASVDPGDTLVVDEVTYHVVRVGSSPLPADERRCAFLLP